MIMLEPSAENPTNLDAYHYCMMDSVLFDSVVQVFASVCGLLVSQSSLVFLFNTEICAWRVYDIGSDLCICTI